MKRFLISTLCAALAAPVFAQVTEGTISLSTRENVLNKLPKEVAYVFPDFETATLYYKDDRFSTGRLNICLVDNSIRFINEKGDTLMLTSQENVRELVLNDTLYKTAKNSIIKELATSGDVSLALRFRLKLTEKKEDAGYSSLPPTSTAVSGNVRSLDYSRIDTDTEFDYKHEKDLIIIDSDKTAPARLSAFIKAFPDRKKEIRAYVKEHGTDFNSQSDLVGLFKFCSDQSL